MNNLSSLWPYIHHNLSSPLSIYRTTSLHSAPPAVVHCAAQQILEQCNCIRVCAPVVSTLLYPGVLSAPCVDTGITVIHASTSRLTSEHPLLHLPPSTLFTPSKESYSGHSTRSSSDLTVRLLSVYHYMSSLREGEMEAGRLKRQRCDPTIAASRYSFTPASSCFSLFFPGYPSPAAQAGVWDVSRWQVDDVRLLARVMRSGAPLHNDRRVRAVHRTVVAGCLTFIDRLLLAKLSNLSSPPLQPPAIQATSSVESANSSSTAATSTVEYELCRSLYQQRVQKGQLSDCQRDSWTVGRVEAGIDWVAQVLRLLVDDMRAVVALDELEERIDLPVLLFTLVIPPNSPLLRESRYIRLEEARLLVDMPCSAELHDWMPPFKEVQQARDRAVASSGWWKRGPQQLESAIERWQAGELELGDPKYWRRYHIRPVQYHGKHEAAPCNPSGSPSYASDELHHWLSFDIVDAAGREWPFAVQWRADEPDAPDGCWGAVWMRDTQQYIAEIVPGLVERERSVLGVLDYQQRLDSYKRHPDIRMDEAAWQTFRDDITGLGIEGWRNGHPTTYRMLTALQVELLITVALSVCYEKDTRLFAANQPLAARQAMVRAAMKQSEAGRWWIDMLQHTMPGVMAVVEEYCLTMVELPWLELDEDEQTGPSGAKEGSATASNQEDECKSATPWYYMTDTTETHYSLE